MATTPQEILDKIYLRGFEPADGYDPLYFTYSHAQTFESYYSEQISTELPIAIAPLNYLGNLEYSATNLGEKVVWVGTTDSGDDSAPPHAIGIKIVGSYRNAPAGDAHATWGVIYVYFIDENGNQLSNEFAIDMEGINDASFDLPANFANLVLCFREDITPPQFNFGISYKLARRDTSSQEEIPRILSDRAVHLGTQGVGHPNEPFLQWFEQNDNPEWFNPQTQVPELTEGGGGGSLFRNSVDIPVPPLPPFEICETDFIKMYNLTNAQLSDLGNYLWSTNFFDNIIKNWTSPFENIISLSIVPLISFQGKNEIIQIGNTSTGVSAKRLSLSRYEINMGRVNIKTMYNSFADFSPFQRLKIYLPYIGIRELNPDDYMRGSIEVVYQIDVFTGVCVAHLVAHKGGKNYVVDSYNGNLTMQIPITGANYMSAFQASLNGLVSNATGHFLSGAMQGMNIKPSYEKSGTLTGQNGRLGVKYPYIFFDTPQFKAPNGFRQNHGYISNLEKRLGDTNGYNEIAFIDLDDLTAIDSEKDEILSLLKSGVYV